MGSGAARTAMSPLVTSSRTEPTELLEGARACSSPLVVSEEKVTPSAPTPPEIGSLYPPYGCGFGREHRLVTPAIRRVLEHRDGGCVVEGCDIPAHLCQADHMRPWALGGRTAIDDLALCCRFHNRWKARHPGRIHITRHPDGRITDRIPRPGHRRRAP